MRDLCEILLENTLAQSGWVMKEKGEGQFQSRVESDIGETDQDGKKAELLTFLPELLGRGKEKDGLVQRFVELGSLQVLPGMD